MPSLGIGRLAGHPAVARRLGLAAAGAAIVGGLGLGVVTAADPAGHAALATTAAPAAARGAGPAPARPLHKTIAGLLRRRAGTTPAAAPDTRALVGRFLGREGDVALIRTAQGAVRQVRLTPQTRLPKRRPRPGDAMLVLGQSAPDGTFRARAVLLRPGAAAAATLA